MDHPSNFIDNHKNRYKELQQKLLLQFSKKKLSWMIGIFLCLFVVVGLGLTVLRIQHLILGKKIIEEENRRKKLLSEEAELQFQMGKEKNGLIIHQRASSELKMIYPDKIELLQSLPSSPPRVVP